MEELSGNMGHGMSSLYFLPHHSLHVSPRKELIYSSGAPVFVTVLHQMLPDHLV